MAENGCPEAIEFHNWYMTEALPRQREYIAHVRNCPRCRDMLSFLKDKLGFDLLKASDEEVMALLIKSPQEYMGMDK